MPTSLLRLLLTQSPEHSAVIQEAIEAGELDTRGAVAQDRGLLADFIRASNNWTAANWEQRQKNKPAYYRLARLLADQGANPWERYRAAEHDEDDIFDHAVAGDNAPLVRWLGTHPQAPANLAQRTRRHHPESSMLRGCSGEMTQALIDLGFDPHSRTATGNTLLHDAKTTDAIRVLLQAGVDPSLANNAGEDAKAYWDKQRRGVEERKEIDKTLETFRRPDPQRLVATFGKQWSTVGSGTTRQRLKDANIDPATAQLDGAGLVERFVAQALSRGMSETNYSGNTLGSPLSHRKCRKQLLSVMRLCQFDPHNPDAMVQRARQAVELFLLVDRLLQQPEPVRGKTVGGGKAQPKVDTSREELRELLGAKPAMGFTQQVDQDLLALERMVEGGLLDNGAMVAGWMLRHAAGTWPAHELGTRGRDGEVVFVRLLRTATREFDPAWKAKKSFCLPGDVPSYQGTRLNAGLPDTLAGEPHAMGAMAIFAAHTNLQHANSWLARQLRRVSELSLPQDEWSKHGIFQLARSKHADHQDMAQRLRAHMEACTLANATPTAHAQRKLRL